MYARLALVAFMVVALVSSASAYDSDKAREALTRSLTFLQQDAAKWRAERGCATCHHGTMSVWALNEAKAQGHAVDAAALAEITQWTKERFVDKFRKPRDPRPGWSLVSVPAIYLGLMSQSLPVLSRDEINTVAMHLANHQEEDGAWAVPPPANGAPPIWESRETLALLAYLAWEPYVPADPAAAEKARASREKAAAWLNTVERSTTTQAATLRLLFDVRTSQPEAQLQAGMDDLLKRQNADGGWSQTPEMASDAHATGQALYALSLAEIKPSDPVIQRGREFLIKTPREDGGWAMTSRPCPPSNKGATNLIPITGAGASWAVLGLVRSAE